MSVGSKTKAVMQKDLPTPLRWWMTAILIIGAAGGYWIAFATAKCGLIIPTMDLESWGRYEREMLHGRLAPIRSAEYGIPVFGVWSSGESQLTDRHGRLIASAGYPGQGEQIAGTFDMNEDGHVPLDRYFALLASLFSGGLIIYMSLEKAIGRKVFLLRRRF